MHLHLRGRSEGLGLRLPAWTILLLPGMEKIQAILAGLGGWVRGQDGEWIGWVSEALIVMFGIYAKNAEWWGREPRTLLRGVISSRSNL